MYFGFLLSQKLFNFDNVFKFCEKNIERRKDVLSTTKEYSLFSFKNDVIYRHTMIICIKQAEHNIYWVS